MHKALSEDGDPDAALIRFAENLTDSEATVLRRALNRLDRKSHT
jgi:hypothetical protein